MVSVKNDIHLELKDFDGCYMPPEFCITKERIEHFGVRDTDIWVTSYPKAGTTWTQEMVWLLENNLDYEGAKVDLDIRFPFIESNCLVNAVEVFIKKHGISFSLNEAPDLIKVLEETPGKRLIKSHLPWHLLPREITNGLKTPKIIHVMRDPKQVAISYYHHNTNFVPIFRGDLRNFIDLYIDGKILGGGYFNVVLSYWNQRHLPNILFLTYEEMHSDLKGVITKVSDFIGKSYSEEEIGELARHLGIDQMKTNNAVNKQAMIKSGNFTFIRTGTTDGYKSELTEEMIAKLNKWVIENVKGIELPYDVS